MSGPEIVYRIPEKLKEFRERIEDNTSLRLDYSFSPYDSYTVEQWGEMAWAGPWGWEGPGVPNKPKIVDFTSLKIHYKCPLEKLSDEDLDELSEIIDELQKEDLHLLREAELNKFDVIIQREEYEMKEILTPWAHEIKDVLEKHGENAEDHIEMKHSCCECYEGHYDSNPLLVKEYVKVITKPEIKEKALRLGMSMPLVFLEREESKELVDRLVEALRGLC